MKKRISAVSALTIAAALALLTVAPAQADTTISLGAKTCGAAPVHVWVKSHSQFTTTHTIYQSPSVAYSRSNFLPYHVVWKTPSPYVSAYASYVSSVGATTSASVYCQGPV